MTSPICHWTYHYKLLNVLVILGLLAFDQAQGKMLRQVQENVDYRLPKHVAPMNYKLRLWPNATNKTFRGTVEITLNVTKPANNVTLHTNKLEIQTVSLESSYLILKVSTEIVTDKRELLIVKTPSNFPSGPYTLKIKFSGTLDGIVGLYASSLKNGRTMVASKFQPTYARQAFPCFDEPDFKATYDITLIKPQNYVALSNMNEISKTLDGDSASEAVTFATSVPMSTYLACFVICDFDFKETEINSNGIGSNFKLRSFAQKDETHKIDFAQDIGKRATEFYINYYEVPFPLPKLDMIAIPDYVSGATEHWGLITYRETSFLVDEDTASAQNKISVANTIAHELAHMWFGNLGLESGHNMNEPPDIGGSPPEVAYNITIDNMFSKLDESRCYLAARAVADGLRVPPADAVKIPSPRGVSGSREVRAW
ncbi:glutamyl aminopeptidase-like [Choristoneura fumiferana]|uniref:glutamyl aminopeptidase-like n=1 Tax=Choristoneura fumiferana TaxID=7141 RepID=UPI003D1592C9